MERMSLLLLIALGGAIGAVSRYLLSDFFQNKIPTILPVGTLVINMLGCFLIGLFLLNSAESPTPHQIWKAFLVIGFIGSFTTFATYVSDIYELIRDGKPLAALLFYLGSTIVGLIMIFIAITFMQFFISKK